VQSPIAKSEPIPGYRVCECLGTGGCGEVWKAEAPGGLTKAIKFVYGYHNEKRAAIELKALERIREVRHPFLLSLERIEVVNSQLVIVTELADGSLRERFTECRREGRPGIPRSELIRYLRDAADALDYMSEQHSLQHLDVKPENLLLLSKRIKVADFGLVKNFRHVTASLMGGLTPLYAAPEVFHGSPSKCSDQYSLAVVYQELLTGLLPFQADSPAELTLLHLNESPDLSSLPESDRPVIARALAKDPANRYPSCVDLVQALERAASDTGLFGSLPTNNNSGGGTQHSFEFGQPISPSRPTPVFKTIVCDRQNPLLPSAQPEEVSLELPELPAAATGDFQPLLQGIVDRPLTPTLILGAGGTAGYVLRHLRRRIHERFGTTGSPAVSMLLLDTNDQSLAAAMRGDESTSLAPNETLELPLRRPQQYRTNSDRFLRWLSRRWLYNIPRSLKTEGLRPLGRLAFVDHAKEVFTRLRQTITSMTDAKAVAAWERETGLKLQADSLRIYLVTSISGGTGSGMILDLAYGAQAIRDQVGLKDSGVLGILMHFTSSNARHREVGQINAFSWLAEYQHFCRTGGSYPGDPSCGLAAAESGRRPFQHTYLTHIGDGLGEEDLIQASGSVADYIYVDLLTPAKVYLDACRNTPLDLPSLITQQAPLRTFGLTRTSVVQPDIVDEASITLCRDAVSDWLGKRTEKDSASRITPTSFAIRPETNRATGDDRLPPTEAQRAVEEFFGRERLHTEAQSLFDAELSGDAQTFFRSLLSEMAAAGRTWGEVVRSVDEMLGISGHARDCDAPGTVFARPLRAVVQPTAARLAASFRSALLQLLDEPNCRLPGTRQTLLNVKERVQGIEQEAQRLNAAARENRMAAPDTAKLKVELGATRLGSKSPEMLMQYFVRAREECVTQLVGGLARGLVTEFGSLMELLIQSGRELDQLSAALAKTPSENTLLPGDSSINVRSLVSDGWRKKRTELVRRLQEAVKNEFTDSRGGLLEVLANGGGPELNRRLRDIARHVALDAIRSIDLMGFVFGAEAKSRLQTAVHAAEPRFLESGGLRHLVAVLPQCSDASQASERICRALDQNASVAGSADNELIMCYEGAGISLAHVAVNLIQSRHDYVELADRVHTRHDVEWTPVTYLSAPSTSETVQAESDRSGLAESVWTSESQNDTTPEASANVL
jgi:serine/threonine protein kinase